MNKEKRQGIYIPNNIHYLFDEKNKNILDLNENKFLEKNNSFVFKNFNQNKKKEQEQNDLNNRDTVYSIFEEFNIEKFIYDVLNKK